MRKNPPGTNSVGRSVPPIQPITAEPFSINQVWRRKAIFGNHNVNQPWGGGLQLLSIANRPSTSKPLDSLPAGVVVSLRSLHQDGNIITDLGLNGSERCVGPPPQLSLKLWHSYSPFGHWGEHIEIALLTLLQSQPSRRLTSSRTDPSPLSPPHHAKMPPRHSIP